jgi:hypothetical protein
MSSLMMIGECSTSDDDGNLLKDCIPDGSAKGRREKVYTAIASHAGRVRTPTGTRKEKNGQQKQEGRMQEGEDRKMCQAIKGR